MKVSIIIPTLNAEPWLEAQLHILLAQTIQPEILIIDSGSTDATPQIAEKYGDRIKLLQILPESFDHGGTRDLALRQCAGDYVLFLTQDALPIKKQYIEKLLEAFEDDAVAAVFGRQIAYPDAPSYEKLTRSFNYPENMRVWSKEDIKVYGVKAYFFSNACSAYRRSAYEAVGGFDSPIERNEDMALAAKLLHMGFKLVYQPEAAVFHSHKDTLTAEYKRNIKIGKVMACYRERLRGVHPVSEGLRLLRFVSFELLKKKEFGDLAVFLSHAAARYIGFCVGTYLEKQERQVHETDSVAFHL